MRRRARKEDRQRARRLAYECGVKAVGLREVLAAWSQLPGADAKAKLVQAAAYFEAMAEDALAGKLS